ncbi:unnamed protein product [Dovyalis caffra]|uniref:Pentatricopeptide repeat-containing protein n=1 Tax=Dovyalis caffra TaxID=77055 RepID=A0AAV1RMY6_9ROSI|nr:unnamed protein product [Dovyalis caffra]
MDGYQEHGSSIKALAKMVAAMKQHGKFPQMCENHFTLIVIASKLSRSERFPE